jgi:hypothetical protein
MGYKIPPMPLMTVRYGTSAWTTDIMLVMISQHSKIVKEICQVIWLIGTDP